MANALERDHLTTWDLHILRLVWNAIPAVRSRDASDCKPLFLYGFFRLRV